MTLITLRHRVINLTRMIEVHPKPTVALSDAKQQLDIFQFKKLLSNL